MSKDWLVIAVLAAAASTMAKCNSMNCGAFVPSSPGSLQLVCTKKSTSSRVRVHKHKTSLEMSMSSSSSSSSSISLQQQIIQGAAMKLMNKETSSSSISSLVDARNRNKAEQKPEIPKKNNNITPEEHEDDEGTFTYYVRKGRREEIDQMTNVLMNSFHPVSQPTWDSYIRRYKCNHLKMLFDAMKEEDRGVYVACAVPVDYSSKNNNNNNNKNINIDTQLVDHGAGGALLNDEQIVGFCSVDGRQPDPSCNIEFLTPSTLAATSPRPYLSDLGVSTKHRRRGIGIMLVQACEQWTDRRGYDKLYLKVDRKNTDGVGLYSAMGYKTVELPWGNDVPTTSSEWDTTVLMEKSVKDDEPKIDQKKKEVRRRRKRTWMKNQLWTPIKESMGRYSAKVGSINGPPPL